MSDSVFVSAVRHMQQAEVHVEPDIQNRLYGLYKQATEGDCAQEAPARYDLLGLPSFFVYMFLCVCMGGV